MTGRDEADRLLEVITVDCYNASEQMTAFYEVFAEQVPLPTTATVLYLCFSMFKDTQKIVAGKAFYIKL